MNATAERRHPLANPDCDACHGDGYVEAFDRLDGSYKVEICDCVLEALEGCHDSQL